MTIAVYNSIHAQTLVGHWTFEKGVETKDLTGNFGDVVLRGSGAVIQDGMLDVGPNNFAVAGSYTGPTISTKTLVSWVSIDSFDTQKGSVLTIDKVNSDEFDAIVFGELQDKRWLAGSMNFARTVSNPTPGFEETELNIPIQMAITYENTNGGTHVIMYRNGNKIADFTKGAFASWQAGDAEIFWGLRHGNANSAGPGRLDCKIEESRIYDSVLTAEQLKGLKLGNSCCNDIYTPFEFVYHDHFILLDKPNSIDLIGQFTFESGEETIDITGHFGDIVLQGATIENGLLEVGTGRGAITGSYKGPEIHEKTLVSWVSIESLPVQKSSVPSILVDNIDAVVPGSVFEKVKLNVMVQLAISYENTSCNAHIKLYENGVKFRDYIKGSFFDVMSGNAEIFWGDRQTSEDCGLGMCHTADARIEESRIYAGVLTEDDLKQLVPRKLAGKLCPLLQ